MTVQVSVTVWTVLCFLALMLILHRLLFKPLLGFMDKRQEKIDRARAEKNAALRDREEELARCREESVNARKLARQEASEALERLRAESERRVAEKRDELAGRLAEEERSLSQEADIILSAAGLRAEELTKALVDRLDFGSVQETAEGRTGP